MCVRFWFIATHYPLNQQNQRFVANAWYQQNLTFRGSLNMRFRSD
jgi:hypothetical protein